MKRNATTRAVSTRLSLTLALLCTPSLLAQATPATPEIQPQQGTAQGDFTLKAYSNIALVDVTVTDAKGQAVHGLPQSAFTILEDGKPQTIRSFSEIGKDTPMVTRVPPKLPPHIYTNLQPSPTTSAVNVLLLDSLNTSPADQIFVKDETMRYLKSMAPGTRIAIMGLSSKLRLLEGFTIDPAILIAAVDTRKIKRSPSRFWTRIPPTGLTP